MAQPQIIADFETQLSTAIAVGATSFSLVSATDDDGVALPNGLYYFTIDNGQSNKEYVAGTLSGTSVTGVLNVTRQGTEASGTVRAHRVGASVLITDFATYKKYIDEAVTAGAVDASATAKGIVEIPITAEIDADTRLGATGAVLAVSPDILALSKYGTRLPSAAEKTALGNLSSLTGSILPYGGRTAPTGYLACDGTAVSRSTYAALFAVLCPSGTFTVTIAAPGVFTKSSHGLVAGDRISLTTTGALPSGLAANTDYYIISSGLTTDAFQVALSPGGSAITTTGSQSGTHTLYASAWGKGDGSTTFNVPDLRGKMAIGTGAPTATLVFEPGAVDTTNNWVTIINNPFPAQGQPVVLTSTGTLPAGLSLATTYYIIRITSTTIGFASSQANANALTPTKIDLTDQGTGVHTMTYTGATESVLGKTGGEDTHGIALAEMALHDHGIADGSNVRGSGSSTGPGGSANTVTNYTWDDQGGNAQHNNLSPYARVLYIIKT